MQLKKIGGRVYGAKLTSDEKQALRIELQKEIAEYDKRNALEIDACILWYLHTEYGFGEKRLKEFYNGFMDLIHEMVKRYEITTDEEQLWIFTKKLKEKGFDLMEWGRERKAEKEKKTDVN